MTARPLRVLLTEIGNFASGDQALYLAAARRILGFGHDVTFVSRVDQSRGLAAAGLPVRQIPFALQYQGQRPRSLDELLDGFQRDEPRTYRELARVVRAHDVVAVAPGGRFVEGYKNCRAMLTAALAHRLGRPVIQLHQSFGPLSDDHECACLRELLAVSRLVLVRDHHSRGFVHSLGVEGETVHEVRDAVFAETYPVSRHATYRVGLNIRTGFNGHVTKEGLGACLRELIREIPATEILIYSTTFPLDPDTAAAATSLGCALETSLVDYPRYLDPSAACGVIAADSFHGFVFSLLAGTPAVACQPDFRSWKLQGTTCPGQPDESVHPGARTAEDGRTLARALLDVARNPAPTLARQSAVRDHARRCAEHGWTQVGRTLADLSRRSPSWWSALRERWIYRA
jgi:hypothetical protein